MMEWGSPAFVLGLVAISYSAWLVSSWIRAKHGYAIENEWSGKTEKSDVAMTALRQENDLLKARLAAFEDRVMVLERIVTDDRQAIFVAQEIESLRDS